jgi:dsDNA-specific endonuclease/ATPase MutS2
MNNLIYFSRTEISPTPKSTALGFWQSPCLNRTKATHFRKAMNEEIHPLEPSDELDLHNFNPSDAKELIEEFIWSCKQSGLPGGCVIHGKGTGSMRELTHAQLKANKLVRSFHLGGSGNTQNWGKTTFELIN